MTLESVLVKPAGPDCDLACSYCFYRHKGPLFPAGAHRMSDEVLSEMIRQLVEVSGPHVSVGWQGGEPTLMGLPFFERAVRLEERHGRGRTVANGLQTSGMHIDRSWAVFLKQYRFLVGLSIDGPEDVHDHYRRTAGGGPTWARVRDAAQLLLDTGVPVNALTVVNDHSVRFPEEIYAHHRNLGLTHMQFIPCFERDRSDPGRTAPFSVPADAYGSFLRTLFDRWISDFRDGAPTTSIRFFESLLFSYAGMAPADCTFLEQCGTYLVVEHNGDVFPCDFFVGQSWKLGNIMEEPLRELIRSPGRRAFARMKAELPEGCSACRWLSLCRGGCTKDRPSDTGGRTATRYCRSYRMFFEPADGELRRLVAEHRRRGEGAQRRARTVPAGKVGRNDPCPCGSGRKYKKCCGSLAG
jgi:uncharacterized protein